ncbi:hypothetical protein E1286_06020 [Nonomuraea terrae]|uniref:Membrane transport protein MMPL domain-containing protein n=1 Tax=Nonomuraea terrae TaxID=2530383 RepID=A0A4R4Z7C8_9ACTN|nr:MMPL family transporter [Nonomuraea terrae]TDD54063.1 hypothetical protein E1286_06020 [Nonomuraea terrae]
MAVSSRASAGGSPPVLPGGPRRPSVWWRLGHAAARRHRAVLAAWLVLVAGSFVLVPGLVERATAPDVRVEGSDSTAGARMLERGFPRLGAEQMMMVFASTTLSDADEPYQRAMSDAARAVAAQPMVGGVDLLPPVPGQDRRRAYATVGVNGDPRARQEAAPVLLRAAGDAASRASGGRVRVHLVGESAMVAEVKRTDLADLRRAELFAVPLALLALLAGLRSAGAAVTVLLVAGTVPVTALGALAAASALGAGVNTFMLAVAATVGLGLGLDYALLILLRYRQSRAAGHDRPEAAALAVSTAGRTAGWCALGVALTAAALMVVRTPLIRTMAAGVSLAAVIAAAVAVTLLPAAVVAADRWLHRRHRSVATTGSGGLLRRHRPAATTRSGGLHRRHRLAAVAGPGGLHRRKHSDATVGAGGPGGRDHPAAAGGPGMLDGRADLDAVDGHGSEDGWGRWARHLMRHPVAYTLVCAGVLLGAAAPVTGLRLGFDLDRPSIAETDFGRGLAHMEADRVSSALAVVLPHPAGTPPVDTAALVMALQRDPGVALVLPSDNGRDTTVVLVLIRTHIDEQATTELARQITRQFVPASLPPGQRAHVTGPNVIFSDLMEETTVQLGTVIPLVLGCSLLFLLVTFRSVLLPLKAVLMNALAVTAAFGLLTLATRHLPHLVGDEVNTLIPLLAFTLVFGLSIDYEIFLIHRIAEHYHAHGDNEAAVVHGLRHTARPITVAAAVMVVTFAALLTADRHHLVQLGLTVAVAIVLDATVIRLALVPALMRILGARNWWLPASLARLLPAAGHSSR